MARKKKQPAKRRVTITDIRRAGFCASGARKLIDSYDVDFRGFLKNGMDQDEFLRVGEGYAKIVVDRMGKS